MTDFNSVPERGDLDSLLGAYALDALDADDRALVDAYIEGDLAARAEVDDMRETAASLALLPDSPMPAPAELWDRIADAIAAEPPRAVDAVDDLERIRARRRKWMVPVAAAAAIAMVILAAQVVSLRGELDRTQQFGRSAMAAAFDRAAKADGARVVGLKGDSGTTLARVVLLPDGTGYLRGDGLAALGPDKTYQLWAVTGDAKSPAVVSAGVLGPDPSALAFRASGPVQAFAVTVENAGGVVKSTQSPVASAQLS